MVDKHMENMNIIRHSHRVDPRSRLPVELFTEIIAEATKDPRWSLRGCIDRILPLTLVSRHWQSAILSASHLWSTIVLDKNVSELQRKLIVVLHLSGSTPIALHIHCSFALWEDVEPLLQPQRARITSLTLWRSSLSPFDTPILPVILQRLGCLPQLESFQCDLWHVERVDDPIVSAVNSFLLKHPHIKRVSGIWLTRDILDSSVTRGLRSCQTALEPHSILQDLEMAPNLEEMKFKPDMWLWLLGDPYHKEPMTTYIPKSPLKWRSYSHFGRISPDILNSLSNTVTTLSLHICTCNFLPLCSTFHNFLALETLEMTLLIGWRHNFTRPPVSFPSPCQTVRRLTLCFDVEPMESPTDWEFPHSDIVHHVFGSIETLDLSPQDCIPIQWDLITRDGFQKLKELVLRFSWYSVDPPASFQLPSTLKCLDIHGSFDLSRLQSSSVERLDIEKLIKVDLAAWPNINRLSIPALTPKLYWPRSPLQNLSNIHLNATNHSYWDCATHFCRDLALYPDAIPRLQALSLYRSPEWDILFILLERYNFRMTANNERISRLTIGNAPLSLLKPLQDLCAGKFTERPSDYELSWIGNIDIIRDQSLPGCLRCHKLLLFCHEPPCSPSASDEPLYISGIFGHHVDEDDNIPKYPDNSQDVLLEWEHREEAWEDLRRLSRLKSCRDVGQNRVLISDTSISYLAAEESTDA
ncbi:hypothetical protein FRC20_010413 [Serendipita sp. 405]|nr:hypothetical protein FRC20_010413 [Serendipita sp. 405]